MTEHTFGIVGAGGMGKAIARRLATAGNTVVVTDNDLDLATVVAAEADAGRPGETRAVSGEEAVGADVVVVAVWYPATIEFAISHASALAGKVVVDIANPLDETFTRLAVAATASAAEQLAKAIPESRVVKATPFQRRPCSTGSWMALRLTRSSLPTTGRRRLFSSTRLRAAACVPWMPAH